MSVPRGRKRDEFQWEVLGDEHLVYDTRQMRYHTLNFAAVRILELADGTRDVSAIAEDLYGDASPNHVEFAEIGLSQLEQAGLLESAGRFSRRAAMRMGISVVAGAGVIPLVSSISVPTAAQSVTPPVPPTPVELRPIGANCKPFSVTAPCVPEGCCCHDPENSSIGVCRFDGDCGTPYKCDR